MSNTDGGLFLVIEGLDGSGKSRVGSWLADTITERTGSQVMLTHEPYELSCAGDFIRQVLTHNIGPVSPTTLALAFAANRADHIDREITPFLISNDRSVVICHRYYLSGIAYQMSSTLDPDTIMSLNRYAKVPDLTIFLDASPSTCYKRMGNRRLARELFETNLEETRPNFYKAIEYLRRRGELIITIDANQPFEIVIEQLVELLKQYSPEWLRKNFWLP